MTTIHYRVPNMGTKVWVVRGATLIHRITTDSEAEATEIAARLRELGFIVTVEPMIDVEIVPCLLLTYPQSTT